MMRLDNQFLRQEGQDIFLDDEPFHGIVFSIDPQMRVEASNVENGHIVSEYSPVYFSTCGGTELIDISDYLNTNEESIDLVLMRTGNRFTGVGLGFDENGHCYREVGFVDGNWIFDAQWDFSGLVLFDALDNGDQLSFQWFPDRRIKLATIETRADGDASLAFTPEGHLASLRLNGNISDWLPRQIDGVAAFPICNIEDLFALEAGAKLILSGDLIDDSFFNLMSSHSVFNATTELYLRATRIDLNCLQAISSLPVLAKLYFQSDSHAQLALARELKKLRPHMDVSFYRTKKGVASSPEVL